MPFKTYDEILGDYGKYVKLQKEKYCSHEMAVPRWEEGQKRYVEAVFANANRDLKILDIACGDGVGLRQFRSLGFKHIVGVDFNETKLEKARESGYEVLGRDMHDLSDFADRSFDIVYSSHSLEHAYRPAAVLSEFHRILVANGTLLVVLPYPDTGDWNDEAHGAKYELGTNLVDHGQAVMNYFEAHGFELLTHVFDRFREPEIWLSFRRP